MIKTLIVDDSSLVRTIIRDFLESDGSFEIIAEAENGLNGVTQAKLLKPDLVTMDIEMPVMNGLDAIVEIKAAVNTAIVVISTHDTAKMAYEATVKGAHEFFAKDIFTSQMSEQRREEIINTLKQITGTKKRSQGLDSVKQAAVASRKINAIVIAASTGGPMALCQLFTALPGELSVPIFLVQHNTSGFDRSFVQWLDEYTPLNVCLAEEGTVPVKGSIYVAPTDRHMILGDKGIAFDDGEPVNNQKPAADILFKSAAEFYGDGLVSVVLTGMGSDGAEGTRYVKQAGGVTIAQDEATSMIYGMPQAAVGTGCIDMILPLGEIPKRLVFLSNGNV
jgi:two-component system chemotaxis response regulator CheB